MSMDVEQLKITNPLQKEHIKMSVKDSEGLLNMPSITSCLYKRKNEKINKATLYFLLQSLDNIKNDVGYTELGSNSNMLAFLSYVG